MENNILSSGTNLFWMITTIQRSNHQKLIQKIRRKRLKIMKKIVSHNIFLEHNYWILRYNFINKIPHYVQPRNRKIWMKQRSSHFWENILSGGGNGDDDYIECFRMTRKSFDILCEKLEHSMICEPNFVREPITVQRKVAIALFKLASCCEYRVVGNVFGVHKSTVHNCVYKFVQAVNTVLRPQYIKMPTENEAIRNSQRIKQKTNVEQIFAFIDGTHIPILPPKEGYRDYINRKGWPSLILQAVVDDTYRFLDIAITHPGSCHDATVFANSNLYKRSEILIPKSSKNINGVDVPLMILGDPAYPLLPWLMKGYIGTLTAEEESFNCYLSSSRICVENAFGRLKARWRCLLKRIDINYKFVPQVISACCVLHNFVEENKETFIQIWLKEVELSEILLPQPLCQARESNNVEQTKAIRNHLKTFMAENYPLRKSMNFRS